ncbi:hypothetical protein Lepto7375DRAFT_7240 [Leptolyngbya sp. PCC 7375]|nr:hypothetical protein Lepto7375DRAFT_7240 [Leptolyngbya sp. PCC 7375]
MKIQIQINYSFSDCETVFRNVEIPEGASVEDAKSIIEKMKEDFLDSLNYEDVEGEAMFNDSDLEYVALKGTNGTDNSL